MTLSFAIIGGGWYGCHIATSFRALGFNVTLFERERRLLNQASGNNQFRLHLGFHYPRHYGTRMQSRDGFSRFIERYPTLSRPIPENLYAVPQLDSLIDFKTYKLIMTASGIDFRELPEVPAILSGIEGCLQVSERVLLLDQARRYFAERLEPFLVLGHDIEQVEHRANGVYVDGRRFDFVIDATWGHFSKPPIDLFYEPTLLLYYEADPEFPAVTMVDGPLCSIYPTEERGLFTLSSVLHTPLGRFGTSVEARAALAGVDKAVIHARRLAMETQVSLYVPGFRDAFRFVGPQLSMKTKPVGSVDDRSCYVYNKGRMFSVMSGKIDTIFFAAERILSTIEGMPDESDGRAVPGSGLRDEVMDVSTQLALA